MQEQALPASYFFHQCLTFPMLPGPHLLRLHGLMVLLPHRLFQAEKSFKCPTLLASNKESWTVGFNLNPCGRRVWQAYKPHHQQACVRCEALLITSNCAPVPTLTFLITGVTLFQQGFDTGTLDFLWKSAIDSQLLSGYIICAVEFKAKVLLSFCRKHLHVIKLCGKGRILAFRRNGKGLWEA